MSYPIILASNSPRRKELLSQINLSFTVEKSSIVEEMTTTIPQDLVLSLSSQKASDIVANHKERIIVIGADTVVAKGHEIFGKPKDLKDAYEMIEKLQGTMHQVITGVTVIIKDEVGVETRECFYEQTNVFVAPMTKDEILSYVETKEPMDKAGAYGIQGVFAKYVERIEGDYYNVVGLPISHLYRVLKKYL